jgi:curved DNA-binding protein CbpA
MDPHIVLGVAPNAGLDEIRQAYKKMVVAPIWLPFTIRKY